jgi:hypothetical protein
LQFRLRNVGTIHGFISAGVTDEHVHDYRRIRQNLSEGVGSDMAADYSITSESIDSAGVKAQSANYTLRASAGGEFGVVSTASITSASYILESGYVARLRDVIAPTTVVSRKVHGASGPTFDINLPLTGPAIGIECPSGGASNAYRVVFTFPSAVTLSDATVTPGPGGTASLENLHTTTTVNGTEVTVNLTGVSNAQTISITLLNVNDGGTTTNVGAQLGVLLGDTSGNKTVNSSDVSQTKLQSGQAVTATNFRVDVNTNGSINARCWNREVESGNSATLIQLEVVQSACQGDWIVRRRVNTVFAQILFGLAA